MVYLGKEIKGNRKIRKNWRLNLILYGKISTMRDLKRKLLLLRDLGKYFVVFSAFRATPKRYTMKRKEKEKSFG